MITYYRWIYQGRQMACYPDVEARRCFVFVRSWLEIGAGVSLVKLEHNIGYFFLIVGKLLLCQCQYVVLGANRGEVEIKRPTLLLHISLL